MSDPRLSAIGALLGGAPEHLVERSAAARAEAQGLAVDEVLTAWSGGDELVPAATAVQEAPPPPASAPAPGVPAPAAPAPPSVATGTLPAPIFEQASVVEVEIVEEEAEPVEPVPLADRIRLGARVGAGLGAVLGLLVMVVESPLVLGRLSETTASGGPAVEVTWTAVAATAAIWAVAGSIITMASRGLGRFRSPSYDTLTTPLGSVLSGGFIGLVLGCGLGGVMYAMAEPSLSGTKLIPVGLATVLGMLVASAVVGAAIGGIGQAMAQPATLAGGEAEDATTVKRRLSDAILLPVVSTVLTLVIVVSFGSLLLRYSGYAPLIAILVAIGTVAFAALMASRPGLRVTRNEVLAAAAGVGVVLLMLALIAASTTDGGGEESPDDHAQVRNVLVS